MVKRKKVGSNILDDEKRNDDGISPALPPEVHSTVAELSESTVSSLAKIRIHVTRTSTKEVQSVQESNESDSNGLSTDKAQKILPVQRNSNRTTPKRSRKDVLIDTIKKSVVATLKPNAPLALKTRRPWELWSVEDKNSFFEALCEYGKDFESIQSYIAQRSKKKGISANMIKNKDQVRHFYYRTWHKISKYLTIGDDVRKQTQEIYGLVNYAELRKKIGGCLNEKNRQKLNELVFTGVTTVKYKGKKLRIKTPLCRALKKLNNVSELKEPDVDKLPKDIVVELRPQSNQAWLHVQNLAQNPRVRTRIPLQRRLKSVIEYLQNRWKPYRLKKKEQIMLSLAQIDESPLHEDPPPILHLRPLHNSSITSVSISAMDSASSFDMCLEKYLKGTREQSSDKETVKKKSGGRLKPKIQNESDAKGEQKVCDTELSENLLKDDDRTPEDSYNINLLTPPKSVEEMDDLSDSAADEAQRTLSLLSSMRNPVIDDEKSSTLDSPAKRDSSPEKAKDDGVPDSFNCTTIEEMYLNSCHEGELLTFSQILSMNSGRMITSPEPESPAVEIGDVSESLKDNDEEVVDSKPEENLLSSVSNDWTMENVGLLTIGEMYLMLGRPSKLTLEYEFEFQQSEITKEDSECMQSRDIPSNKLHLVDVMRKLVQVATCTFVEAKNRQTPLSPTFRNISNARVTSAAQTTNKSNARCTPKNASVKSVVKPSARSLAIKVAADSTAVIGKNEELSNKPEICSTTTSLSTICSDGATSSSDNHVFVVPVGTAPRIVKKPTQESLREEIDKLLPSTRRGCRVRRKPLVVQRPLLPRDGIGTAPGPRPMTLVHLVPSGSQLTAVIPSNCGPVDKTNVMPSKKVVKILSAGPAIDVRPLQVPLIPQTKTVTSTHLVVTPAAAQTVQTVEPCVSTIINAMDKNSVIITTPTGALPSIPDTTSLVSPIAMQKVQSLATTSASVSIHDKLITSSPPQISIPETSCTSSVESVSPFIRISMVDDVSDKMTDTHSNKILDFSNSTSISGFSLPQTKSIQLESENLPSSENTPPQSPPSRPFRINSPGPEAQWLNGESGEFSLNTLLNTLESPCKVLSVSSSINLANENSNSDPITRLAPVVDSQVRCLLEECSVDFIAKFEDLADVINSSNNDSKPA